jgi:hypothetical protein
MLAAPKITTKEIADIISAHCNRQDDVIMYVATNMLTLMLKRMPKSHPSSILYVLYIHRKIIR